MGQPLIVLGCAVGRDDPGAPFNYYSNLLNYQQ